jgi:hypothetical protein
MPLEAAVDLAYLALIAVFFGVSFGFIKLCEQIRGRL